VLDCLGSNDILLAMYHLDTLKDFKVGNNFYYEVKNPNSEMFYPVKELIEAALELKKVEFKNSLFDKPSTSDPVYIILDRLGFNYSPKKKENILLKLSKTQDLRNEIYIPKKYIGKENKFFPDPRLEDPAPQDETPHIIKVLIKWKGIDSNFREYDLKNFRIEFDANADTRIAGTPSKSLNSIIIFKKIENKKYEVELIEKESSDYTRIFNRMDNKSYMLLDEMEMTTLSEIQKTKPCFPLNQILYGPPGTGKTDATVEKALQILDLKTEDRAENRDIFRSLLNKKIFFVTMHPSYSYEDFVQGIKPKTSSKGDLLFEPKSGIFKIVSDLAKTVYEDDGEIIDNEIDNIDILRICFFLSKFNTKADRKANLVFGSKSPGEAFSSIGKKFNINPNTLKNHRDKFDFLTTNERKGWQPRNGSVDTLDNSDLWPYNDIYNELNDKTFDDIKNIIDGIEKKTKTTTTKTEHNINYVLILDEINRANISKVFGELITLLEEDKRIGNENELSVTLPSGEVFSVPPNLYIIGTMNTADKSIALVDIALRRRFQFIPVYPDSSVIANYSKSDDKSEKASFMDSLNTRLRVDKGVDFQIGHAYFLKENSLADVINENIIPLLVEYLRNDLEKVKKLLSDLGKPLDEDYYTKTGLLKYIG
jgi:5-methylcytosine-specific restriction protein B